MGDREQELFGLMAVAQEQQQAAAAQLAALEKQRAQLTATIEQARRAVEAMRDAGAASAGLIEQAAQQAVEKGVDAALWRVSEATKESLANATGPALNAIKGAAGRAQEAEQSLRDAVGWVSWKWATICGAVAAGMLAAVWSLAMILTPGWDEIQELRATVADLERRGGKIKLSTCGDRGRLCARIDVKASGAVYGANGENLMILSGY